jgi:hypothetical protein
MCTESCCRETLKTWEHSERVEEELKHTRAREYEVAEKQTRGTCRFEEATPHGENHTEKQEGHEATQWTRSKIEGSKGIH